MTNKNRRPISPEQMERIVNSVRIGQKYTEAAQAAGVNIDVLKNYISRGRDDLEAGKRTKYGEFWDQLQVAEAEGELSLIAKIQSAANDNWAAAAWLLARRYNDRWGSRVELTGKGGQPVKIYTVVSPEMWDTIEADEKEAEKLLEEGESLP